MCVVAGLFNFPAVFQETHVCVCVMRAVARYWCIVNCMSRRWCNDCMCALEAGSVSVKLDSTSCVAVCTPAFVPSSLGRLGMHVHSHHIVALCSPRENVYVLCTLHVPWITGLWRIRAVDKRF